MFSTGLFGSNPSTFGSPNQPFSQPNTGTTNFGSSFPNPSHNLFGGNNSTSFPNSSAPQTGFFGSPPANTGGQFNSFPNTGSTLPSSGGFFPGQFGAGTSQPLDGNTGTLGSGFNSGQTGASLFGSGNAMNQPGGTLFGTTSQPFGNTPGLFGSSENKNQPGNTGLFGTAGNSNQFGGTGLFGGSVATTQPSPTLFGNTNNTLFGASTSQPLGGSSLFGALNNQPSFGGTSSFNQPTPFGGAQTNLLGNIQGFGVTGNQGTAGLKISGHLDQTGGRYINIMREPQLMNGDKSLEECRLEDYKLRKAGKLTFAKQANTGILGGTGTSLFSSNTTSQFGGSLFSNTSPLASSALSSGGLFGPSSTGLGNTGTSFGMTSTGLGTSGGLLSSTSSNTGSLFGGTGTGLFSSNQPQNKPGGLFGGASAAPQTNSLFGSSTLFSNDKTTTGGLFNTPLNNLNNNTLNLTNQPQTSLFSSTPNIGLQMNPQGNFSQPNSATPYLLFPTIQPIPMPTGPLLLPTPADNSDPYTIKNYFTGVKISQSKEVKSEPLKSPYDDVGQLLRRTNSNVETSWSFQGLPSKKSSGKNSLIIEDTVSSDINEEQRGTSVISNSRLDGITLHVKCFVMRKKVKVKVRISNSSSIQDLKNMVIEKLKAAKVIERQVEEAELFKNNKLLKDSQTISDIDISKYDKLELNITLVASELKTKNNVVASNKLPKLTNTNYKIIPNFEELSRMTMEELGSVEDFTIENEFGKIVFSDCTDVLGLDLDKIVKIEEKRVVVYPSENFVSIPEYGKGLNKPATITLYKCFPRDERIDKKTINKRLEKAAKKQSAKHISYDEQTGAWTFSVSHF